MIGEEYKVVGNYNTTDYIWPTLDLFQLLHRGGEDEGGDSLPHLQKQALHTRGQDRFHNLP